MRSRGSTPRRRVAILKEDDLLDREFDGFVRKLITYMMEDPAHHLAQPRPAVRGQGHRAHRRPREEHRRVHHLRRQGRGRAPQLDGADRVGDAVAQMKNQPRILIVEDEPAIAELVAVNLRHNGFAAGLGRRRRGRAARDRRRAARRDPAGLDAAGPERPGAGAPLARAIRAPRRSPS